MTTDLDNIKNARFALCGANTGYPSTMWDRVKRLCDELRAELDNPNVPPMGGDPGPFSEVEKLSDDVAQQSSSRFPAYGTNLNLGELIFYARQLTAQLGGKPLMTEPQPATPNTPTNLAAKVNTDRSVELDWDDSVGASSYRIYESVHSAGKIVDTVTVSNSKRGPLEAGNYKYSVTGVNDLGESLPSAEVNVLVGTAVTPTTGTDPRTPDNLDLSNVLWYANYDSANNSTEAKFNSNIQRQPGGGSIQNSNNPVPVVDAPYGMGRALKFVVPGNYTREEVNPGGSNSFGPDLTYHAFAFAAENGFPVDANNWQLIWQLHGNDVTSPRYALQLRNNELRIGDSKGGWSGQIKRGVRYNVILKCDKASGRISVWLNGKWVLTDYTCGKSATPYYQKDGIYHEKSVAGGTLYQTDHAIGRTFESVAQFFY